MLTQARLKEVLHYDPHTGLWTWLVDRGSAKAGDLAGCWHCRGYLAIGVDGVLYLAHRLAFLYIAGSFPTRTNHKNRNRANNRWGNLREATVSQSNANRPFPNKLGVKGVFKDGKRFVARIKKDKVSIYLGRFGTPDEAHMAYVEAAKQLHGEFAA